MYVGRQAKVASDTLRLRAEAISDFCRRHHFRKLSLFGSVLSDRFRPKSGIDVSVEFESEHTPGFAFFTMQDELSAILGRHDLQTPGFLSRYFRDKVTAEAEVLYDLPLLERTAGSGMHDQTHFAFESPVTPHTG